MVAYMKLLTPHYLMEGNGIRQKGNTNLKNQKGKFTSGGVTSLQIEIFITTTGSKSNGLLCLLVTTSLKPNGLFGLLVTTTLKKR
jgi:hypothetical protein